MPTMESDSARDAFPQRKTRIVIAEDNRAFRQALARLLSQESDLEVIGEAVDGATAIEAALRLRPEVLLMDVSMPGMNGIDATRAIRAQAPEVDIIALTVYQEPDQEAAMRGAGAVAYVTKTSPVEELLAAIRGHSKDPFFRLKVQGF